MGLLDKWLNGDNWDIIRTKTNLLFDKVNDIAAGTTGQLLKKNSSTDFDYDWADQYPSQAGKAGKALISTGTAGSEAWGSPIYRAADTRAGSVSSTGYSTGTLTSPNDINRNNILTISAALFNASEVAITMGLYKGAVLFREIKYTIINSTTDDNAHATCISYSFADLNASPNVDYSVVFSAGSTTVFVEHTFILDSAAI